MKGKKILFLKAQGLGDIISGIPKLADLKSKGYEVYQTFYDMRHLHRGLRDVPEKVRNEYKKLPMYSGRYSILETLKKSGFIDEIILIPYGVFPLLWFLAKNLRKFDEVIISIKTKPGIFLGKILGKKRQYIFKNPNDIKHRRNVAEGELGHKSNTLYHYTENIQRDTEKIDLPKEYVVIFPSIRERSIDIEEWTKIINFIRKQNIEIVVVGGAREKRFMDDFKNHNISQKIINLLGKTSFGQLIYILQHAKTNISCNGGVMRLANLVNQKNINIHAVSAYLMEPPVDDIYSYNLRPYAYAQCIPCEASNSTKDGKKKIPQCIFYNTAREGECRKTIKAENVIALLNRLF